MDNKKGFFGTIKSFATNHPIIFNLMIIIVVFVVVINILLMLVDIFTEHGKYKVVPSVKSMTLQDAITKVEADGFRWDVTDSIYSSDYRPGVVVEQTPKENSKIKSNRIIYFVINAMTPRMVTMPDVMEISERQAVSLLEGLGLKNIRIETVSSPYKGLVIDCKVDGRSAQKGRKIPASASVVIFVGDGGEIFGTPDSVAAETMSDLVLDTEPVEVDFP